MTHHTIVGAVESPAEADFVHHVSKYTDDRVQLVPQVSVRTICGTFRTDFVATAPGGLKVAFECDGEEFHSRHRDEWRAAMILGAGAVQSVVHMRARDLYYHINDVLFVAAQWYPELFSERGRLNLAHLCSSELEETISRRGWSSDTRVLVPYFAESPEPRNPFFIDVERFSVASPRREFWRQLHAFAQARGGGDLDALMMRWPDWRPKANEPAN